MSELYHVSFIFYRVLQCVPVCFHIQNNIAFELAESTVRKDENKKGFVDKIWLLEQKVNYDKISFTLEFSNIISNLTKPSLFSAVFFAVSVLWCVLWSSVWLSSPLCLEVVSPHRVTS